MKRTREEGRRLAGIVADAIEQHADRYQQGTWAHYDEASSLCGTAGCVAGWPDAVMRCGDSAANAANTKIDTTGVAQRAADGLALEPRERVRPFCVEARRPKYPDTESWEDEWWAPSAADAVATLRQYRDHDVVEWVRTGGGVRAQGPSEMERAGELR